MGVTNNTIGYGYDLGENVDFLDSELKPFVVDNTKPQSEWKLPSEKAAEDLLKRVITRKEAEFNKFLVCEMGSDQAN